MGGSQVKSVAEALEKSLEHRKDVIEILSQQGRYGWEKWLQVELASKLFEFGDPEFDKSHGYDHRKLKPKSKSAFKNLFVDLQFRAKHRLKRYTTAIEIKLNRSLKGLRPALSDLLKIKSIRTEKWMYRSVIVILVYGQRERETKYSRVLAKLEDDFGAITGERSGYGYVVFGWERNRTQDMSHSNYKEWVDRIQTAFGDKGIIHKTARRRDA